MLRADVAVVGRSPGRGPRPRVVIGAITSAMVVTLTTLVALLGIGGPRPSASAAPDTSAKRAGLSRRQIAQASDYLAKFVADGVTPGAIIQVKTPKGTWSATFGRASKSPSPPSAMKLARQHRIGSVTKTFTTTLVLMLVDEGKIGLDDPISKYVSGVPSGDQITVRMLGTMTSGLAEFLANDQFRSTFFQDPMRVWQPQELLAASYAQGPRFAPGSSSEYSNANTVLLGLLVEAVEGEPFGTVLEQKILKPAHLDHTAFPTDERFTSSHTHGYTTLSPGKAEVDSTAWSPSQAYAAGQMISTTGDLTRWAKLLGTGALLSPELQAQRLRWDPIGDNNDEWHYTFGIEENSGWLGHNGQIPGYLTFVVYHPDLDASIVILMNTDRSVGTDPAVNKAMRELSTVLFPDHPVRVPAI